MKEKLIKTSIIIFVIIISLGFNKVFAADNSLDFTVTGDKTKIKQGEQVTLELKVSNINAGKGIIGAMSTIVYNSDVLSYQVEKVGDWDIQSNSDTITVLYGDLSTATNENQTIAKIIFTAKDNASTGKQTISFKNTDFSLEDTTTFSVDDVDVEVEIEPKSNGDTPATNNDDNNNNNNDNENNQNQNNQNEKDDNNENDSKQNEDENSEDEETNTKIESTKAIETTKNNMILPYAGKLKNGLVILILLGSIVAVITYTRYKYWKNV